LTFAPANPAFARENLNGERQTAEVATRPPTHPKNQSVEKNFRLFRNRETL
jgi:hypothetical protein